MKRILLILSIFSLVIGQESIGQNSEFAPVSPTGIPYSIVVGEITLNNGTLPISTSIAVFDDTLCVGQLINSGNINQQLVAWEGDPSQNLLGFSSGNTMIFKVRLEVNGDFYIIDAVPSYVQGNGSFGYGNFTVVNLAVTTTLVEIELISSINKPIGFPNPFSSQTRFNIHKEMFNKVDVIDNTGRVIFSNNLNHYTDHFIWSGENNSGINVPNGIYFIRFSSGIDSQISKVIYQRNFDNHIN